MENGYEGKRTQQQESNTTSGGGGSSWSWVEMVLRVMGMSLTLIAAIIVGVDKQTKVVPITVISSLPPLNIPLTAQSKHLSAFVYFVVANAVACAYGAISLLHPIISRKRSTSAAAVLVILDMLVAALLFSSNGAAGAIGLMGYEGNSHVRWKKVCNVFDKFCNHVAVALVLSFLASLVFLLLVARAVWRLHKR